MNASKYLRVSLLMRTLIVALPRPKNPAKAKEMIQFFSY
jgi:hypothetical protein